MPRLTIQTCAHCRCNIRGDVVALPHPERAYETTGFCVQCAEAQGFECNGCNTRYHPIDAAVMHEGDFYCDECDPRTTCNECGAVLDENDPDERVAVRSLAGAFSHFCNEECANHAGFERDGRRWFRRAQVEGVRMIPWRSVRRAPFRMNKTRDGADITIGVEIENRFTHAPRDWEVKSDASLLYSGSNCWEMVSPILSGTTGLRQLQGMLDAWKQHNPSEAKNAGTHVHVGVGHLTVEELALLTEHWERWGEDFAAGIVTRKRFENEYCRSIKDESISGFIRRAWCNYPMVAPDVTCVRDIRNRGIERTIGVMERRKAFNILSVFKHGTVEFRLWSASTNPRKIVGWAAFCANFVAMVQRLDRRFTPEVVYRLCERYGVMRVGLRMLDAGAAFSTWTRERWDELARRNDISLRHLARRTAYPWGSNPAKPPRGRSVEHEASDDRQRTDDADGTNRLPSSQTPTNTEQGSRTLTNSGLFTEIVRPYEMRQTMVETELEQELIRLRNHGPLTALAATELVMRERELPRPGCNCQRCRNARAGRTETPG